MPASIVVSIMDFNIFQLIKIKGKPTIAELSESLKADFTAKKVHANVKKLEKNGFIKLTKKGACQLTLAAKKELKQITKRIDLISEEMKDDEAISEAA